MPLFNFQFIAVRQKLLCFIGLPEPNPKPRQLPNIKKCYKNLFYMYFQLLNIIYKKYLMKATPFWFLILFAFTANAQLIYIGDDAPQNKFDGYQNSKRTAGLAVLGNNYFFITPNGKFYQTDGTEKNTLVKKQFSPQDVGYLKASNKYVYFTEGSMEDIVKNLTRYSPTTGFNLIRDVSNNYSVLQLNHVAVPGQTFTVDEMFVSYDKNDVLIRKFTKDNFYVYSIHDPNDNANANLVYTRRLGTSNLTMPINMSTEIETRNGDVYFNGRENPTGVFETTINIIKPVAEDDSKYEFKYKYAVLKSGLFPYNRFLRTNNNIYSLFKVVDSAKNEKYLTLYNFKDKQIADVGKALEYTSYDVDTQIMDGEIYISYKGNLHRYSEEEKNFIGIIIEKNASTGWEELAKNTRFLKVGNYYLYRRNGALFVYDYDTRLTKEVSKASLAKNYNFLTQHNIYAYAGNNSFYFTQRVNEKEVFTKYNPVTNTYTPIIFPDFKKNMFEETKAILHNGNKFVFLTSYNGKKDKSVYKMFMYTEEGESLANKNEPVTPIIVKPEPKKETNFFDIKTFDKKLFVEQLMKILNDQSNQFKDITAESIPSDLSPKYKSTIKLDGFGEGVIIDYKRDSYLMRYEAESVVLKGKFNGLAFLDLLDSEVQKLVANNGITRVIDVDVKVRKLIHYLNTDGNKLLQLDLYCPTDFTNPEEAVFTLTIRADKRTK